MNSSNLPNLPTHEAQTPHPKDEQEAVLQPARHLVSDTTKEERRKLPWWLQGQYE